MKNDRNRELLIRVSNFFKVLSDPTRLSILLLIKDKELAVGTIADLLGLEQSTVSHQLKNLRDCNMVKYRRIGQSILYSQLDDHIYKILDQALEHVEEKDT